MMNSNATLVQRINAQKKNQGNKLPPTVVFLEKTAWRTPVSPCASSVALAQLQGLLFACPGNLNTQIPASSWTQATLSD